MLDFDSRASTNFRNMAAMLDSVQSNMITSVSVLIRHDHKRLHDWKLLEQALKKPQFSHKACKVDLEFRILERNIPTSLATHIAMLQYQEDEWEMSSDDSLHLV